MSGPITPVFWASGMNSSGGTRPRTGWLQRTSTSTHVHLARAEVGLRLVVEHELALVDRATQLGEHRQPARAVVVALLRVDLAAAGLLLRHVHRDVGALEQRMDVVTVLRVQGDADAGLDLEGEAVDRERLLQRLAKLAGDRGGGGRVDHLG